MTEAAYKARRGEEVRGSWAINDPERPRWDARTETEAEFDYELADGEYAYTVRKGRDAFGEKVFTISRRNTMRFGDRIEPEHHQDWFPGRGEHGDLLYRLPQLLAAPPEKPVFVCEGEKDAQRLADEGLIATTGSCGAGKWRKEFTPHVAGRDVIVLVDNDEVGRQHGDLVVQEVHTVARSVKVVELPNLPPKGDVSDWLDAENTVADLMAFVATVPPVTDPGAWANGRLEFAKDKDGKAYRSPRNARLALGKMGVSVRYDEFARRYLVEGLAGFGPVLDDHALTRLQLQCEERFGLIFGKQRWADIVRDFALSQRFHPVREFLDGLTWDEVPRLDRWLSVYGGAEDSEYVRAVAAITLIAAVRRVRSPGCKFDEMLVLESPQGWDKSGVLSALASEPWFTDDCPLNADSKELIEKTDGSWIVEMSELKGLRGAKAEHVKSMLSRRVDKARLAYGYLTTERPRQCVFVGTTNESAYLRDLTGNRRFWPVKVKRFNLAALTRDRDQLWAEAAAREAESESIRLPERLWSIAAGEQAQREVGDPFLEILRERLEGLEGKVRGADLWEIVGLGDPAKREQRHNDRLPEVMAKLGWRRPKSGQLRFGGANPESAWVKGDGPNFLEVDRKKLLRDGRVM